LRGVETGVKENLKMVASGSLTHIHAQEDPVINGDWR
jgi:hypothetical protein